MAGSVPQEELPALEVRGRPLPTLITTGPGPPLAHRVPHAHSLSYFMDRCWKNILIDLMPLRRVELMQCTTCTTVHGSPSHLTSPEPEHTQGTLEKVKL